MIFTPTKHQLFRSAMFVLMLIAPLLCYSLFALSVGVRTSTDITYFWLGLIMVSPLYLGWAFLCVIVNRIGAPQNGPVAAAPPSGSAATRLIDNTPVG